MYYRMDDDGDVLAARPPPLVEVRPQSGVQRHTAELIIETFVLVQVLDVPVPQMGNQVMEVLQKIEMETPEQVIAVPTISLDRIPQRSAAPTIVSFSSLQQRTVEQIIDIPVPRRGGGGGRRGLQGLRPGQKSTARFVEQNVDIPVPAGGLHDLPDPGSSRSPVVSRDERGEGVFLTFHRVKKSPKSPASLSPRVPARSSSWTQAAYAGVQAGDEYDEYFENNGALWKQAWDFEHQCYCWCEVCRDGGFCFLPPLGDIPDVSVTWSRPGTWSWPCDSSCTWSRASSWPFWTVYEMECFLGSLDGVVPVNMQNKFQQSVQDDSGLPRLQFIDRVGHFSYATVTGITLVQTVQKTVKIPPCSSLARLLSSRCCATTGALV